MALLGFDAFSPDQIAGRVATAGVAKARLPWRATLMLGIIAGGFIGLGALYSTIVMSDATLPFALRRVIGGGAFSLGLVLVVVAGAELFTGNNLLVMAWADRKITTGELARNWAIVYFANAFGAIGLALIVYLSRHWTLNDGAVAATYVKMASAKTSLPFVQAFIGGVLCNLLVCLALWLALAGRSVADKILAIVFPVSAFVAAGFEHSIANMYLIPLGILLRDQLPAVGAGVDASLNWTGFVNNLVPVTLGNIAGGGLMVAGVYHLIYNKALGRRADVPPHEREEPRRPRE